MCDAGEVVSEDVERRARLLRVLGDAHNNGTDDYDVVAEHHFKAPGSLRV
jgi:hypothetical protein